MTELWKKHQKKLVFFRLIELFKFKIDKSPEKIYSKASKSLFIGNLNRKTTADQISNEFKQYGKIISFKLIKDIITNESKGYCFVEFKHFSDAYEAYKMSQNLIIDNQKILIDFERDRLQKGWKPRRFGGGLGGRKNSGQMRFSEKIYKIRQKD